MAYDQVRSVFTGDRTHVSQRLFRFRRYVRSKHLGRFQQDAELVRHPVATYYGRVVGDSMVDAGVDEGDILVIDKSLDPSEGDMAVCFVDGEFTLKTISFKDPSTGKAPLARNGLWLLPANRSYPPIHITDSNDFTVWGIVTYIIKKVK